jgi:hypothetical protein
MLCLSVADFLPDIQLPSVPNGDSVQLRESGGKTSVVVTVHGAECSGCRQYLGQLAGMASEFAIWDARLLVILPSPPDQAAHLEGPGIALADEHRRLAETASASLLVADRYGQIFYATHSGACHDLPAARELEEWLKYLGTLCPE